MRRQFRRYQSLAESGQRDTLSLALRRGVGVRKVLVLLAVLAAASMATAATLGYSRGPGARAEAQAEPPNIVFVYTDDQEASSLNRMRNLQEEMVGPGRTFENTIFTYPLCCPSRATLQTGMYAHNSGVLGNTPPYGGYGRFRELGRDRDTAATRLDAAGYDTGYFGKYMNNYRGYSVPPGWDRWFAKLQSRNFMTSGPDLSDRVPITGLPSGDGMARDRALAWLDARSGDPDPFFMQVGFYAPHDPADYQDRYVGWFKNEKVPRTPAFNEPDFDDKPHPRAPLPSGKNVDCSGEEEVRAERCLDKLYRDKLRSVQVADAFLGTLFDRLEASGELGNTYVMFHTDNGVHLGQHRLPYGKTQPYETDVRFPLVVRGPGVEPGTDERLVGNHDLAPTITDLAGAEPVAAADGRSVTPLLFGAEVPWRDALLSEQYTDGRRVWSLLRGEDEAFVRWADGEREYYDLETDPYQVENSYPALDPEKRAGMEARLDRLEGCAGEGCREAEGR